MCSSDLVWQEQDVVLRSFKCWMMCYDHDDNDDYDDDDDVLQEQDVVHDEKDDVRCVGSAKMSP